MISVRNLTKHFGEFVAVQDASFEVQAGEVMGFLGPNGAGKTTTIRILTGYLPATSGTVQVDGLDVLRKSLQVRQRIGYLPESVPLYLEMRVQEYLRYRGLLKGVSRKEIEAAVGRAMELVALTHMARRIIGQLSKGYRQRVGLADALVSKPKILILDEPTGGLDPHQRKEVLDLIRTLSKEHTILLSSHVLAEVETISDRVMIIQQGQLLAQGTPGDLIGQLQAEPLIHAEVKATEEATRQALQGLVSELAAGMECKALEDGWLSIQVTPLPESDPREAIAERLLSAGLKLRELRRTELSLEELFLRITAQSALGDPS
jgi:ABC-2 type transport system ATP-binding protein